MSYTLEYLIVTGSTVICWGSKGREEDGEGLRGGGGGMMDKVGVSVITYFGILILLHYS
jgi:hypothetical protein